MNYYEEDVAIQAPDTEKRIHDDCLSCGQFINHPLCHCCVARGFRQWLKNFPKQEKEVQKKLAVYIKGNKNLKIKARKCVSCGEYKTKVCPYCFTEYLYKILKEAGFGVRALSEFLFIFNFDFSREGYSVDLEAYGGY